MCVWGYGVGYVHPPSIHSLEGWGQPFAFPSGSDANLHQYIICAYLYVYNTKHIMYTQICTYWYFYSLDGVIDW